MPIPGTIRARFASTYYSTTDRLESGSSWRAEIRNLSLHGPLSRMFREPFVPISMSLSFRYVALIHA